MVYGLWFEPERVVANTDLHKQHPDWLLRRKDGDDDTYLLNFGLPEVQEYFFNIVADLHAAAGIPLLPPGLQHGPAAVLALSATRPIGKASAK